MCGLLAENGPVTIPKFRAGIPAPNPASGLDAPLIEVSLADDSQRMMPTYFFTYK